MDEAIAAALLHGQVQSLHDHVVKNNAVPSGTDAVLLSVVMGVGAIAGLIANPVVGALLDRTAALPGTVLVALLVIVIMPRVVAPLAAGVGLGLMNSYPALFALSGFVTITATWTVSRVRSVR